ncbi:MAG: hypothetical protein Q8M94_13950 [Ignavibacteria bacterium]|nr:hypothetical protein [Ignavibacteria bacterium]
MPVIASITVEGVNETAMAFGRLPSEFYKVIDKELSDGIIRISNTAKEKCPYRTGTLRRSIMYSKGDVLEYLCGTDVNYSEAVEYGSSPHLIVPRFKKVLKFKIDGEEIFSKFVRHPGTSPQPFLEPALFENEDNINKSIQDAIINKIKSEGADVE